MFGSKKDPQPAAAPAAAPATKNAAPGAKNRPTRSRREAEAARRRSLVPVDRKAARRAAREHAAQERQLMQASLARGEETHLPPRDKGPVKRFVRDYVDARRNVGEVTLYVIILPVLLMFIPVTTAPWAPNAAVIMMWTIMLATAVDAILLRSLLKRAIVREFGESGLQDKPVGYGMMRALQMRRTRLPKPRVKHGGAPIDLSSNR